jgi:hypothetical protein
VSAAKVRSPAFDRRARAGAARSRSSSRAHFRLALNLSLSARSPWEPGKSEHPDAGLSGLPLGDAAGPPSESRSASASSRPALGDRMRAPVRPTEVSLRRSVRCRGHIDRGTEPHATHGAIRKPFALGPRSVQSRLEQLERTLCDPDSLGRFWKLIQTQPKARRGPVSGPTFCCCLSRACLVSLSRSERQVSNFAPLTWTDGHVSRRGAPSIAKGSRRGKLPLQGAAQVLVAAELYPLLPRTDFGRAEYSLKADQDKRLQQGHSAASSCGSSPPRRSTRSSGA